MTALRLLFVMDPIGEISFEKDSTFAFMEAAQARGHEIFTCRLLDLSAQALAPRARARRVKLQRVEGAHHQWLTPPTQHPLGGFDAVFMRKDPPFDMNFIFATYILSLADEETLIINRPQGLRDCNEKAYILRFPELIPPTLVARDMTMIKDFVKEHGRAVLKPLDGKGGEGILLVEHKGLNLNSMIELLTRYGERYIMIQGYVPESRLGDKRILMVGGKPVGAFLRVPADDDLRGNMCAGASVTSAELNERDLEVCAALSEQLMADGHYFVGIDLLGPYLTEINVTSPTGIQEIRELSGIDTAVLMIEWVEQQMKH